MTSIRFVGDLPLWGGLLLALCASLGAWWYYRRDSHALPGRLRWLLPLLRAFVIFLVVITITGPVLHHRQILGELGRVLVFVDASQSMGVTDKHMPIARKLLVAQQQGWIPSGQVDMTLWEVANDLSRIRLEVTTRMEEGASNEDTLNFCRESLDRTAKETAEAFDQFEWSTLPAGTSNQEANAWSEMPGQFRQQFVDPAAALVTTSTDDAESREETARQLLDLCGIAASYERALRNAFDLYGSQLATSNNPAITSAISLFDDMSRWRRAENNLLNDSSGLLGELNGTHDVEVIGLTGSKSVGIWDPAAVPESPSELGMAPSAPTTDLGSGVTGELSARMAGSEDSVEQVDPVQRTAVILISDGRRNAGGSPLQMAQVLGGQSIPIHTLGYGGWREPPDLALLDVEHPDMVFQKDRIRGSILINDQMPPGQSVAVQIGFDDEILWQNQVITQDVGLRRVEFEFSIDSLVKQLRQRFDDEIRHHALPLALQVSLAPLDGETETANNARTMRFAAITQNYKILLIDGRARWETRYLRNVFQRDEQWQVDTILVGPTTDQATLPRGDEPDMFPTDKTKLYDYDLILFGEVPPGTFTEYELGWIRDFVENRGGGIVFIDGQRGQLRMLDDENFVPLLPVSWFSESIRELPARLQLTEAGLNETALMLKSSRLENERFWEELPPPHQIIPVEAVPGTEVLAEAWVGNRVFPVFVTRSFGAGRVLYLAFDETWRWRYKVADTYHQRFWNQMAKWAMQRPFAVSDEYVSLDSGPPRYDEGDAANLRVRLRGANGRPVSDATVDAMLWKDGRVVSAVNLASTETGNGIYLGRTGALVEGEYEVSVRAAGYANDALKARTQFVVLPPKSGELEHVSCHVDLMREIASASGGRFLREEEIGELPELLGPLSSGRIVESDTLLWQSYWWFSIIVTLLAIEWFLRKRAGLL